MTSPPPLRGIKPEPGPQADRPAARRALVESETAPAASRAPLTTHIIDVQKLKGPVFGRAERQLIGAFVATVVIVLVFTVLVPVLMAWFRNF